MNKHYLLRRASVIHAIKCDKTTSFEKALASSNRLKELLQLLVDSEDDKLEDISNQINEWAASNPMVLEKEINQLIKN